MAWLIKSVRSQVRGLVFVLPLALWPAPAGAEITPAQLSQIQSDLRVTLTADQVTALDALVNPAVVETWRSDAQTRISQHRQAQWTLTLQDKAGAPLAGATVRLRQKSRPFRFGGVLELKTFSGVSTNPPAISIATYKALALAMFDSFGLNNGFKPRQMGSATDPNSNQNLLPGFLTWASTNSRPVRGHCLIWPGLDHLSATVEAKTAEIETLVAARDAATDPSVIADYNTQIEAKKPELRTIVDNEITSWASRWTVTEWDVMNEVITNVRLTNILGTSERTRWFNLALAAQPAAKRLINEYQIISASSQEAYSYNRIATFKTILNQLVSEGAPVTGIGFQSRFGFRREDPALLYTRLQGFAPYGLDLEGTEHEVIDNANTNFYPSETLRAQITEEVMTTYFSHPSVKALYAWTFIIPGNTAGLFDTNGVPKLNGLVWYYVTHIRYRTDTTLTADSQGRVDLRAYKGDYDVVINYADGTDSRTLSLSADTAQTVGTSFTAVPPDTDGDGMPDSWETAHGLNPLAAADAGLDPDGDGRPNFLEYLLGRDPQVAEPLAADLELQPLAGGLHVKWRRRAADHSPGVGYSTDLATWQVLRTPADFTSAGLTVQASTVTQADANYEFVEIDLSVAAGPARLFLRLQP